MPRPVPWPPTALGLAAVLSCRWARAEDQPTRLRITNGCSDEPVWIAHEESGDSRDPQNVRIEPGESYDFQVWDGLTGTRYWPKMRCDKDGSRCGIGESGGPGQTCSKTGCAPPVDTKFEASFGQSGTDWVDISLVDGYTLPFKFEMKGGRGPCAAGIGDRAPSKVIDCSRLSISDCPRSEDLGAASADASLQVTNPETGEVVGCYSPCSKLTLNQWENPEAEGRGPWDEEVLPFCCPTPPESPHECRKGPVGKTQFVEAVHRMCPGVYGFSYDDGMGLLQCPDDTKYEVTFYCPDAPATTSRLSRESTRKHTSETRAQPQSRWVARSTSKPSSTTTTKATSLPEAAEDRGLLLDGAKKPRSGGNELEPGGCPDGYELSDKDLDGEGKAWTESLPSIFDCAEECNLRDGCTGFEFHAGKTYARRDGESTTTCGTYTGGESNIQAVGQFGGWVGCLRSASPAAGTSAEATVGATTTTTAGASTSTTQDASFWEVVADEGVRVLRSAGSKHEEGQRPRGAMLHGSRKGSWIVLREGGAVQAPGAAGPNRLREVKARTWKIVCKDGAPVQSAKNKAANNLDVKPSGVVFEGVRDGFWIAPRGEDGFVPAELDGQPLVEEVKQDAGEGIPGFLVMKSALPQVSEAVPLHANPVAKPTASALWVAAAGSAATAAVAAACSSMQCWRREQAGGREPLFRPALSHSP